MLKNFNVTASNIPTSATICRIRKKIPIDKKYMCNSGEIDFDLLANYIHVEIAIISAKNLNFFRRLSDAVV